MARPPLALRPPTRDRPGAWIVRAQEFLAWSWTGRVLLAAIGFWVLAQAGVPLPCGLDVLATVALFLYCAVGLFRLGRWLVRRLLWRIRTKLLVSYLFIAVLPLVLLALLFVLAGIIFSGLVASYIVTAEVGRQGDLLRAVAADGLAAGRRGALGEVRGRIVASARAVHPAAGFAFVQDGRLVAGEGTALQAIPDWIEAAGFAGLVRDGEAEWLRVVAREGGSFFVIEAPLDASLFAELERRMAIRFVSAGGSVQVKERQGGLSVNVTEPRSGVTVKVGDGPARRVPADPVAGTPFFSTLERRAWATGEVEDEPVLFQFDAWTLVRRLSPGARLNMGDVMVTALAVVGGVFLAVYSVALLLGLVLARSITRSVHELYRGTERLREGDFTHPIRVHSRDQLGDLAESFNAMSESVRDLLVQQAEKERLEEELRIARHIQMSLLPQGGITLPGLRVSALCLPAAEVGGDYYDLLPLSPTRMGVLVADVSGKGTSAALYMAELKGLVLSLSRIYDSPAQLLGEANRILAGTMDVRSFITMTYAVVDVEARVMRFARAGHNPLIRLVASSGRTELLTPPGLGLGLDRGTRFDEILEESQVPLEKGDVFLFFTDGLSEAMNAQAELFGERRLRDLLENAGAADAPEIKDRILEAIRGFVGDAAPHDDMTLVLLRVL